MTDSNEAIHKSDDASAGNLASGHVVNGAAGSDVSSGGIRGVGGANGVSANHGLTPIPASIVKAICAIKSTVEALKKSGKNPHGGYQFSSTDDLYAAIARKMGDVGLMCLALEVENEIKRIEKDGKTSQWLRVVYQYVWATETDTWTDTSNRRTVCTQVTGPQTYQAAQSFAEKAYLRSTFKLPSGDMDLDSMPQADTEEELSDMLTPRKKKSSSSAKKDGTAGIFNDLRGAISGADGPADLHLIKKNAWSIWEQMPERWRQILDEEFEDKLAEFEQMELAQ